jgi:hypothetical protein
VENKIVRSLVSLFQRVLDALLSALKRIRRRDVLARIEILSVARRVEPDVAKILYENRQDAYRYGINRIARAENDYQRSPVLLDEIRGDENLAGANDSAHFFMGRLVADLDRELLVEDDEPDESDLVGGYSEAMIKSRMGAVMDYEIRRLARTEAAMSENLGAYREMERRGVPAKRWLTREDTHVRDSHETLQGQVVALYDFFDNGLLYPGDILHGDPEDWMNCRCWIVPARMEQVA